jgi:hypothetical protein
MNYISVILEAYIPNHRYHQLYPFCMSYFINKSLDSLTNAAAVRVHSFNNISVIDFYWLIFFMRALSMFSVVGVTSAKNPK